MIMTIEARGVLICLQDMCVWLCGCVCVCVTSDSAGRQKVIKFALVSFTFSAVLGANLIKETLADFKEINGNHLRKYINALA